MAFDNLARTRSRSAGDPVSQHRVAVLRSPQTFDRRGRALRARSAAGAGAGDRVRVTGILVPHGPVYPAFAFRFDTAY